ncbi:putative xyloglucan endotransglucosylase/hydrolase protein 32 [Apostasia shenzhenica]|uniref:Putative xyloglucan endotransglucosylase/hydrolase protein 32 n=1 Tax=Apostasia shenzhenica TaxID=1088818 RepID=A0A2H9ZWR4_9ASPA|nr:putative xyloglucan endotransglucosylase/hydrolase protein 32 [Apostasia shenzhenica]
MAEIPSIYRTEILKQIAVDYCPEACLHSAETDEIHVVYNHRGGTRWRSPSRFRYGNFGARIRCPSGNTSGLNYNIYLSSLEGDKSQDEIDFEFLGRDNSSVQTNFYIAGAGGREQIHPLGFDASEDFHEYLIRWGPDEILWLIDGVVIRREVRREGDPWPEKPMFLYASVWDASYIDEGRWTGNYNGCDAPYVCKYKEVRVPIETIVIDEEDESK